MKARLARYLIDHKGFSVLALESGAFDVECVRERVCQGDAHRDACHGAIFHMLDRADETQELLQLLDEYTTTGKLTLTGFDSQQTGQYSKQQLTERLQHILTLANIDGQIAADDWAFFCSMTNRVVALSADIPSRDLIDRYLDLVARLKLTLRSASILHSKPLECSDFWHQILIGIEAQAKRFWGDIGGNGGLERERLMANHLLWLLNTRFKQQKIIVWTHNLHAWRDPSARMMGGYLGMVLGQHCVSVGLSAAEGSFVDWKDESIRHFSLPANDSIEAVLNTAGQWSGIDLRTPEARAYLANTHRFRLCDYTDHEQSPVRAFDLMLQAQRMTPSTLRPR